ncbi:hypothetical protein [Ferrovibrio terrae]|uniref:hypothetical protein n=1 Tax=Ferrovibrio terrae TaxID=2594003 RepID=UPI003137ABE3
MSKQDKNSLENHPSDSGATAECTSMSAENGAPAENQGPAESQLQAVRSDLAKSEQSRQFNAWLDRALPQLQRHLGSTSAAVTSPGTKPKH